MFLIWKFAEIYQPLISMHMFASFKFIVVKKLIAKENCKQIKDLKKYYKYINDIFRLLFI